MNLKILLPAASAAFLAPANAALLFYSGEFDGRNGLACERNTTVSDARTYEDFDVPSTGWRVDALYGEYLISNVQPEEAYFEIRTGITEGNGGNLLQSGQVAATFAPTGRSGYGLIEYRVRVAVTPFDLAAGKHWLTVAPIGNGSGRAFVSTTSGRNGVGVPLGNGNSYFDSPFFGLTFTDTQNILGSGHWDFSFGVEGTLVPEPASLLALAGVAPLLRRRRRK